MDRRVLVAFLDGYESTCGEGALVDFVLGEFAELAEFPTVAQAAEVIESICCEYEELADEKKRKRAGELLARLKAPSQEAAPEPPAASPPPLSRPPGVLTAAKAPTLAGSLKAKKHTRKRSARKSSTTTTRTAAAVAPPRTVQLQATNIPPPTTVISQFFARYGGSVIDPAMESYFISLVEDAETDDSGVRGMSTFLPFIFANAPSLPQDGGANSVVSTFIHRLWQSLMQQRAFEARADRLRATAAARKQSHKALLPTSLQVSSNDVVTKNTMQNAAAGGSSPSFSSSMYNADIAAGSPAVRMLQEIVPGASAELCEWVLNTQCTGDVTAASIFLVECKNLNALDAERVRLFEERRTAETRAAKKAAKLEKAMKKATLGRYAADPDKIGAMRPVPNSHDGRRFGKVKEKKKKGEMESRWIDGKRVKVRKGTTKILVEFKAQSVKEDWNGGSSGRVIRKSQRLNARR
jgi:hypothetical protein